MEKKKFLILTENFGRTAPGVVFERLVRELCRRHEVIVVCLNDYTADTTLAISSVESVGVRLQLSLATQARLSRIGLSLIGDDWGARVAAASLAKVFEKGVEVKIQFDYVFSLVSYRHISPLILAEKIIRCGYAKQSAAYFVDAIPAPLGWSINNREYRGLREFVARRIRGLDFLFSSNEQMLEYQRRLADKDALIGSGVLYNPVSDTRKPMPLPATDRFCFLYTGSLYGRRTPKYLLSAFREVLKRKDNVFLVFVGSKLDVADLLLSEHERNHVIVEPFTSNLEQYYRDATALVDIDADLENDIYLSSKIMSYLPIDRLILSETGKGSPASILFGGIKSIIQCGHDAGQLAEGMLQVIEQAQISSFDDREVLIHKFSAGAVVDHLEAVLRGGAS